MDKTREIEIRHPRFAEGTLTVRPGVFGSARLIHMGLEVPGNKRTHTVVDRDGKTTAIVLKGFLDPVPAVEIDGELVHPVPPLRPYELAWLAIPLPLMLVGGALGAFVAASSFTTNVFLFRRGQSVVDRYGPTGIVSFFTWTGWLTFAFFLGGWWHGITEADVQRVVDEVNARTPIDIDDNTRLVGADFQQAQLRFNYRLTGPLEHGMGAREQAALQRRTRDAICSDANMLLLLEANYSIVRDFRGFGAAPLLEVQIRRSDCERWERARARKESKQNSESP